MADFLKHRKESVDFSVDFTNALATGDSVTAVSGVSVLRRAADGSWTDVSSEFGSPSGTLSGAEVEFTLGVAATGNQPAGAYVILVEVTTNDGETLIDDSTLWVQDVGDPDAP